MKGFKTGKNRKQNRAAKVLLGLAAAVGLVICGNMVAYAGAEGEIKSDAFAGTAEEPENISAAVEATGVANPANPVHHCTQKNDGTDYTDWSYVYFGSYPQSEVTGNALTSAITGASYDANGDAWVNGTKYRRISKSDTNYDGNFGNSTYRYFKWERIQWRVLKNDGNTLFVMADIGLDCKDYHDPGGSVTWENSTLRNWLNSDFYRTAFNSGEQNAIVQNNISNAVNLVYGTEGGRNTTDKIFLLSLFEVQNTDYGFCGNYSTHSVSRRLKVSDYAYARGADTGTSTAYVGNCYWWLRSPGDTANTAADVSTYGHVDRSGTLVYYGRDACVPALHINLSSDLWLTTDDGTSGSGGSFGNTASTVNSGSQNTGAGSHVANGPRPQNINAVSRTVAYSKKAFPLGASTDGDGALTYRSSNPKVAAILPNGSIKMKNYGTTVITISASHTAACLAAVKQVTVEVVPKKGVLKQASSPYSRRLKIAWKKDKKVGGYEVQISMSKSFRSKTIKRLYPKGKTGITLVGLQSKKQYYVRTRSYAKAGKKKVYGEWSRIKSVRVK